MNGVMKTAVATCQADRRPSADFPGDLQQRHQPQAAVPQRDRATCETHNSPTRRALPSRPCPGASGFFFACSQIGLVHLLVERRAAGGELPQLVVLGAHQRRAVGEGAAHALAVELAPLGQQPGEVGIGKAARPTPTKVTAASATLAAPACAGTPAGSCSRCPPPAGRERLLDLPGEAEVAVDADQGVLRRLVAVRRYSNGRKRCGEAYGLPMLTFTRATPSFTISPTHASGSVRSGRSGSFGSVPQAVRTGACHGHGSPTPSGPGVVGAGRRRR